MCTPKLLCGTLTTLTMNTWQGNLIWPKQTEDIHIKSMVPVKVPLQTDNFDQISRCILHPITAKVKYVSEFFLLCLIKY